MTLREKQSLFMLNIGKLIMWAYENGYELTEGEGQRTESQQLLYFEGYKVVKIGSKLHFSPDKIRTKTLASKHEEKLAHDFNVFRNGELMKTVDSVRPVGDYWKSLRQECKWGGDWGWDKGHFQMF